MTEWPTYVKGEVTGMIYKSLGQLDTPSSTWPYEQRMRYQTLPSEKVPGKILLLTHSRAQRCRYEYDGALDVPEGL